MGTDEGLYHAKPQIRGKIAHETVDNKTASNRKDDLLSLPVYSEQYKLMGKVDVYRKVMMKPSFRPVFYWSNSAEANYLLRQKLSLIQH